MKIGKFESADFTDRQKLSEIESEVEQRWKVFKRLVTNGKMKQETMDRKIACMIAVRDDYRAKVQSQTPEGALL